MSTGEKKWVVFGVINGSLREMERLRYLAVISYTDFKKVLDSDIENFPNDPRLVHNLGQVQRVLTLLDEKENLIIDNILGRMLHITKDETMDLKEKLKYLDSYGVEPIIIEDQ